MISIKSTNGKELIFDKKWGELFLLLNLSIKNGQYGIVQFSKVIGKNKYTSKTERVHRVITGALPNEIVDHINGNTLDNRECNLRVTNKLGNNKNRWKWGTRKTSSIYKGVTFNKKTNCWQASIMSNRVTRYLGANFATEADAAKAYNKAAKELHGDFARLNVIND